MELRKFTLTFRLLHWAIAFCILFMLLTVFLKNTWMDKEIIAPIIKEDLETIKIPITSEQSIRVAKDIRKPMWSWHVYIGYVLIGLYFLRISLATFHQLNFLNPFSKDYSLKEKFESWVYIIFYGLLAVSLVTGFLIVNGPENLKDGLKSVHELSVYYVLFFIFIHFAGVFIAEMGNRKGIVSKMISGDDKPPNKL